MCCVSAVACSIGVWCSSADVGFLDGWTGSLSAGGVPEPAEVASLACCFEAVSLGDDCGIKVVARPFCWLEPDLGGGDSDFASDAPEVVFCSKDELMNNIVNSTMKHVEGMPILAEGGCFPCVFNAICGNKSVGDNYVLLSFTSHSRTGVGVCPKDSQRRPSRSVPEYSPLLVETIDISMVNS